MNAAPLAVVLHAAVPDAAPADELDVLTQADTVTAALSQWGFRVERLALTLDLHHARRELTRIQPRLVFNLVESLAGKGHYIHLAPTLLEDLGLAFTGAPATAMWATSNKLAAKQLFSLAGLPTPAWRTAAQLSGGARLNGRWLVKSVWEHASIGLNDGAVVDGEHQALQRLEKIRRRLGGVWFVERFVAGREFNLALLQTGTGWRVLPAAEIVFQDYPPDKPKIVGYAAKWRPDSFEYRHTPRRFTFPPEDRPLLARLRRLALRCPALFGLRGYARVDVRVDHAGRPWVLEVNANPCLSPDAGFAAAAAQAGLTLGAVIGQVIAAALSGTGGRTAASGSRAARAA